MRGDVKFNKLLYRWIFNDHRSITGCQSTVCSCGRSVIDKLPFVPLRFCGSFQTKINIIGSADIQEGYYQNR